MFESYSIQGFLGGDEQCLGDLMGFMTLAEIQTCLMNGTGLSADKLRRYPALLEHNIEGCMTGFLTVRADIPPENARKIAALPKEKVRALCTCMMDFGMEEFPDDVGQVGRMASDPAVLKRLNAHCKAQMEALGMGLPSLPE